MKYLILTNHSYMLWQFRRELLLKLQESGEVVISTPFVGHEDDFKKLNFKCIETKIDRRSINPFSDYKLYRFYKKIIESEKPDIVITYSIKPNIYGGIVCKKNNIPYIVNVQGLGTAFEKRILSFLVTYMYRYALRKAFKVLFENIANSEVFLRKNIIEEKKVEVLPGAGVNLQYFKKEEYPSEKDGIHFLYLGRIMKEKGIDELLEVIVELKNEYDEKIIFDMVGFFEDEYKVKIEKFKSLGLINFYGFQEDPKPFYKNAHCLILPSYHEGMSNVLLEAAATGRALITTNIPGCREAVDDGENGFLCIKKNKESLKNSIIKFIKLSPLEREKMGILGRNKVENTFDKKIVVYKIISIINGIKN